MSLNKVTIQDRRDLEKYIKFLALKSSQIVVQSRLGEKIQTECNPHTSANDWFNIAISDQADVLAETKKVLQSESVVNRLPLCVEISLQTVEGDKMILEVWTLSIISDQINPQNRTSHTIYNRMGLLLKSLLSVTRVTPAYKLSRRQNSDSYQIYYRIYTGEPQTHHLGDGFKQVRVGQLCTQIGTLNMAVAYRTKMTISPTTGRDNTMVLKSDHFLKDISPKHNRYNKKIEKKIIDLDQPLRCAAFADASRIRQYTEDDFILPETPPFSWLLRKTKEENSHENSTEDEKQQNSSDENSSSNANNNNNNTVKSLESNPVFRMSQSPKNESSASPPISLQGNEFRRSSKWSNKPAQADDDRLFKELHFPFATNNSPIGDLAKFYRECFNAPPLQEFSVVLSENNQSTESENRTEQTSVDDLTKQLEEFESSLPDYDNMISSIFQSVDNNLNS